MISPTTVVSLLLSARRDAEDAMMLGVAVAAFVLSVGAVVGGVMLTRKKNVGAGVALFVLAALGFLSCLGISALLVLAQFAWH
jgi:hypothetical protein